MRGFYGLRTGQNPNNIVVDDGKIIEGVGWRLFDGCNLRLYNVSPPWQGETILTQTSIVSLPLIEREARKRKRRKEGPFHPKRPQHNTKQATKRQRTNKRNNDDEQQRSIPMPAPTRRRLRRPIPHQPRCIRPPKIPSRPLPQPRSILLHAKRRNLDPLSPPQRNRRHCIQGPDLQYSH